MAAAEMMKDKVNENLALRQHVHASSSFDAWCGPELMVTGRGNDDKKWIAAESTDLVTVALSFPTSTTIKEFGIVWGLHNEPKDLRVRCLDECGAEIEGGTRDWCTVIAEGLVEPEEVMAGLTATAVVYDDPPQAVRTLELEICPRDSGWLGICDLVVHGNAPAPPPPQEPKLKIPARDIIDPFLSDITPCEAFFEADYEGETNEVLSTKKILLEGEEAGPAAVDLIRAVCNDADTVFVDSDFPAEECSINPVGQLGDAARRSPLEDSGPASWCRIHDFCPAPELFKGGIDMNDLDQGAVGDCWLVAAIASLTTKPEQLRSLFYPDHYNKEGVYAVRFYAPLHAQWLWVLVDGYVPVSASNSPYFMSAHNPGELWPMLLEKAFAKLHTCYGGLDPALACGGVMAMKMMTGASDCTSFVPVYETPIDEVWGCIKEHIDAGCSAACGVADENWGKHTNAAMDELGVVYNHVFSCVGARELADGTRLLRLRNPWGDGSGWNGAWSDQSGDWTEERQSEVPEYSARNDGTFWIAMEDFYSYWYRVELCRVEEPSHDLERVRSGNRAAA